MLRLLIARHGQTDWNAAGRNQGHADTLMDEAGRRQAAQLAEALRTFGITAVFSSDLARTSDTAKLIAETVRVPLAVDARLRERSYGLWEGKTVDEIEVSHPRELETYREDPALGCPPGGESGVELFMRVGYFLSELLAANEQGSIAIVSHGGTIAALIAALIGGSPATAGCLRLMNCALSEIVVLPNGRRTLLRLNDISHLDPPPAPVAYAPQARS